MQSDSQLLPDLAQIAAEHLCLVAIARGLVGLVERESRLAGDAELLEGAVDEGLFCGAHVHRRLHLAQALGDEQDAVDQHAVRGALDLEVAEESVRAK